MLKPSEVILRSTIEWYVFNTASERTSGCDLMLLKIVEASRVCRES